ncbi:cytochrome P450 [Biscogniauxia sp. FL1348]|nr:cytochrome P450 [Biscogniauxia sp. FL1348]
MTTPIPGPRPWPIFGNAFNITVGNSILDMVDLAAVYGPIYKLRIRGEDRLVVTSQELVDEVFTRKDFAKYPTGFVQRLKDILPEGIFSASPEQESWGIVHRTLQPKFGSTSVKDMFPEMMDTISQLVLKWARFGPDRPVNPVEDFTRLTLDTITLMNSFYMDEMGPEVKAMAGLLHETARRTYVPWWITAMMGATNRKYDEDTNHMRQFAAKVIADRRANRSTDKKDLVDAMLNGHDPKTGKQLTDDMISDNMITFLGAGYETTAGLLSFAFALLLTHPEEYSKLQAEVDSVLGTGPITLDHIGDLKYTKACLWEALRLYPPSGILPVSYMNKDPEARTVIGNKWEVKSGQTIAVVLHKLHRDPKIWGDDLEEFKPERMMGGKYKELPRNSFKPFGNGMRACIGRAVATQESIMAVALLFQKLDFKLVDPNFKIQVKQNLAIKPHDYFIRAWPRPHVDPVTLQRDLFFPSQDRKSPVGSCQEKRD